MHTQIMRTDAVTLPFLRAIQDDVAPFCSIQRRAVSLWGEWADEELSIQMLEEPEVLS